MSFIKKITSHPLFRQMIRFGIVGVAAFFVEIGSLNLLTQWLFPLMLPAKDHDFYVLAAAPVAFLISAVFNYILSLHFVFKKRKDTKGVTIFSIFLVLNLIALGLNELWMWLFAVQMGINHNISKVIATALVTIYNFISRKIFIEDHQKKKNAAADSDS